MVDGFRTGPGIVQRSTERDNKRDFYNSGYVCVEVDGLGWSVHVIGRCHSNSEPAIGGRFCSGGHRQEVSLYTMDSRGAATECSPGRKPGVCFGHDDRAYYLAAR